MIYSVLFLLLCIIISAVSAWTDIHTGYVYNRHLLLAALIGICVFIVSLAHHATLWLFSAAWLLNLSLSIVLSVILYLCDVWAPGDAKLYIFTTAFYPREFYAVQSGVIFPSLNIVVFAYSTGFVFLVISAFRKGKYNGRVNLLPEIDRDYLFGFIVNAGIIIGLQTLMNAIWPVFSDINRAFVSLAIVGLSYIAQRIFLRSRLILKLGLIITATGIIAAFANGEYRTLLLFLPFSIIAAAMVQILISMSNTNSYKEISGAEVRPGMILSFGSILAMQNCIDPDIPRMTTENRRSRISNDQATAVQKWCDITGNSISIVEMLPFAPLIGIGIVLEVVRFLIFYREAM